MDNQQKYVTGGVFGIVGLMLFAFLFGCTAPMTGINDTPPLAAPQQGTSAGSETGDNPLVSMTRMIQLETGGLSDIQIVSQTNTNGRFEALLSVPNPAGAPVVVNVYPAVNNTNLDEHIWVSVYGIQQEITYFDTPRAYYTIQTPLAPATFFANVSAASLPISTIEGSHLLIVTDTMTFTPQSTGSQDILITYEASEMPLELFVFVNDKNITLVP